jgi:hypothetical protein
MDVFATFKHGTSSHKSPILDNIGMEPKWQNCHYDFLVKGYHEEIEMGVFDKNPLRNREVGDCKLSIDYLIKNAEKEEWHEIFHDKKSAGKILLRATWTPVLVEEVKQAPKKLEKAMEDMSISKSSVVPKHTTEEIKEMPPANKLAQSTVGTRNVLKMLLISANLAMHPDMEKFNNSSFFVVCKIKSSEWRSSLSEPKGLEPIWT